jgi:hypothetical protein
MALSEVTQTIVDGGLGAIAAAVTNDGVVIGVFPAGTAYALESYGSQAALIAAHATPDGLGTGEAVDAACAVLAASGRVLVMPVALTVRGGVSSVTAFLQSGSSAAMTALRGPAQLITAVCVTGGLLGTATFTFALGTGAAGAVTTSAAGWSTGYRVPSSFTTAVFTEGTGFDAGDTFTISTLGVVAQSVNAGAATGTLSSQTSSPFDNYRAATRIITGGALGTATFQYALDYDGSDLDAATWSAEILTPGGGAYALPGTGIYVTFSGTAVADDYFTFNTAPPQFTSTELGLAFDALAADSTEWGWCHPVHTAVSAAAAKSWADALETELLALATAYRYVFGLAHVPSVGTPLTTAGTYSTDSADTDSVIRSAFTAAYTRVACCAGDAYMTSLTKAIPMRRNASWAACNELARRPLGVDVAHTGDGGDGTMVPLRQVVELVRDERVTPSLDAAGFTTLRTYVGVAGAFVTQLHMFVASTSDFFFGQGRRVLDVAQRITRAVYLPLLNGSLRTTPSGERRGLILAVDAQRQDNRARRALEDGLVNITPSAASAVSATIDRTVNLLSTRTLEVEIAVVPNGYAREIEVRIGYRNPALS